MIIENINSVYFTATNTTRRVVRHIAEQLQGNKKEYNITQSAPEENITMKSSDLLVVGMPVYSGRIPAIALPALDRFKGNGTPAIIVCVYGNRDYDDALLELKDVVESNGFKVISAGAFIAQHSIFPKVGQIYPQNTIIVTDRPKTSLIMWTSSFIAAKIVNPPGNYYFSGNRFLGQPKKQILLDDVISQIQFNGKFVKKTGKTFACFYKIPTFADNITEKVMRTFLVNAYWWRSIQPQKVVRNEDSCI